MGSSRDSVVHLDTHIVIWLYAGATSLLPPKVRTAIEANDLLISPMVSLELQYLFEVGKIGQSAHAIMDDLAGRIGLRVSEAPFADVIRLALHETWTRDPFDRLIVAHARLENRKLLTKDDTIRRHFRGAIWG